MKVSCFRYALVVFTTCALPAAVFGQTDPKEAARQHFDRGFSLATEGVYAGAIAEFSRAYQLSPHFAVLYNLGQAYAASGQAVLAVDTLRRYLAEGGTQVPLARHKQVQEDIARQERRIALVTIRADLAGATIWVDGVEIGKTPLSAPVRVARGAHVFAGTIEGHRRWERTVQLGGEERKLIEIGFERLSAPQATGKPSTVPPHLDGAAAATAVPVPPRAAEVNPVLASPSGAPGPEETPPSKRVTASVVIGGLGVVVGGVSTVLFFWNKHRHENWSASHRQLSTRPELPNRLQLQAQNDDLARSIRKASVATVSTAVLGAALLATGIVLYVKASRSSETAPRPSHAIRVGPGYVTWQSAF